MSGVRTADITNQLQPKTNRTEAGAMEAAAIFLRFTKIGSAGTGNERKGGEQDG